MKEANLKIVQKDEKLTGGFLVLSSQKLRRINGGEQVNTGPCVNRDRCGNTTNTTFCTNYGATTCLDATNVVKERCFNYD